MKPWSTGSDRIERLEHMVEQQSQEIQDLKAQMGQQPNAQVSAAQFEALQNQVYETQAVVKAATTPQDKKIHFKGITFTFGGFLAMESVWRSNNLLNRISVRRASRSVPGSGCGQFHGVAVDPELGIATRWTSAIRANSASRPVRAAFPEWRKATSIPTRISPAMASSTSWVRPPAPTPRRATPIAARP